VNFHLEFTFNMIDPLVSLAFSLQSNKGAYALLVGSGVSRSAGIPTGWEITLDLVRKLASASGKEIGSNAEEWFLAEYGKTPDYSELLDQLCKAPSERQQYLKQFFEPNEDEREQGLKAPTAAHHAIAAMMAEGYIRVIVTTNFDRMLEQALEAKGIVPVVIANADQVKGMLPLAHQKYCIIKVHGDYLDTRIKNTASELESYAPEMDQLLDRVCDEFGLIICGWSGVWDPALRSAIVRAPSRRFSSYWAARGKINHTADELVNNRGMTQISIEGADKFFSALSDNLESLREFDRPHPLSVQAAVASVKRYLVEDRYRIKLSDLMTDAVDDARARWKVSGIELGSPDPSDATLVARMQSYDVGSETLIALGAAIGKWGRPEHHQLISDTLVNLCAIEKAQGRTFALWSDLARYPATIFFYAFGIAATQSKNYELLGLILRSKIYNKNYEEKILIGEILSVFIVTKQKISRLFGDQNYYTPVNIWLENLMRKSLFNNVLVDTYNDPFSMNFDQFELFATLAYRDQMRNLSQRIPVGCWGWRYQNRAKILEQIKLDIDLVGGEGVLARLGLFSSDIICAKQEIDNIEQFSQKLNWY
jgi:hypothetical protein